MGIFGAVGRLPTYLRYGGLTAQDVPRCREGNLKISHFGGEESVNRGPRNEYQIKPASHTANTLFTRIPSAKNLDT